ncbi:glycosyltransferase family 4 protein [Pelomicrobium sp.]|jgi:glycosyltransferase involved in cell wall biosynthesis|uniref:glycosyltransferase family 4 protein n=1 Tax=Pelomicrobium sp. TaxID=2815319 RepID=UPI002FDD0F42
MRIAQIAPLIERVPPRLYGGTERVVYYLTEELARQGHEVTLFASGDSVTSARLVASVPEALRLNPRVKEPLPYVILQLEQVRQQAERFDILHFHVDFLHFPIFRTIAGKTLTTLHGRLDLPDLQAVYREFREMPLVSISDHQRLPMPPVNWIGTVYHGLPRDVCPFNPSPKGDYFAFLGRISPEKRPDRAIEIARRAGVRLRIAAKVDKVDEAYFRERIEPLLSAPHVEFIGEIDEAQKAEFLGNALGLLFPIDWPEPFGLVMIEAMSCGTPVIAWRCGSVPEVVEPGLSGFIVESIDAAVEAVRRIHMLDRTAVRRRFEQRFSAERMARDYLALYQTLIARETTARAA